MGANRVSHWRLGSFSIAASACLVLLLTMPTEAQIGGLGPKPKGRDPKPKQPPSEQPQRDTPGSVEGQILKFKPAKEGSEDDDLIGYLYLKPSDKGSKPLRLKVNRDDELRISVGDHELDQDEFADVCMKGLYCTVGWGFEDADAKKPKIKELHSLSFGTIEVEGKISKIEDGLVQIKGKPKNGDDWPGADSKSGASGTRGGNVKEKPVRTRTLKLRIMDDVSKITDSDNIESDLNDFSIDDEVVASVVFGRKQGVMVALRPAGAKDPEETGRGGRPDDRGGPTPGGRGGPTVGGG